MADRAPKQNVLLIGATGLLGQAMFKVLDARGYKISSVARHNAPVCIDITKDAQLQAGLERVHPDLIINCAALVNVEACENDPGLAWRINARPLSFLAEWSRDHDANLIHISTDQYYTNGLNWPHSETDPIALVNEYSRTKYAGECLALIAPDALVVRTSIVGLRGWKQLTFAEWAIDVVEGDKTANLFSDAYTSSIDTDTFSSSVLDLFHSGAKGLYNLASSEVYSKESFVREMAAQLGMPLSNAIVGSVKSLEIPRANCLGLNIERAQDRLGYSLPKLEKVVGSILEQHQKGNSL